MTSDWRGKKIPNVRSTIPLSVNLVKFELDKNNYGFCIPKI
ncbi:hypothetical protein RINTHH_17620 [Richelia intracellularis HH01]|uniref:Uncharacterized protein n=1 Tax=Richelia intracellularis HH01 TaxID=1165094 RepID=M1WZU8_9NOST|nr:hypothetical protein RINTHH_17620 [Richelia intracellularis HH01]